MIFWGMGLISGPFDIINKSTDSYTKSTNAHLK